MYSVVSCAQARRPFDWRVFAELIFRMVDLIRYRRRNLW